ncbi:MAG TPA: HEPN domain-containing protein [Gemmatimonadaceae bacterium]|jgi:HEPN domain-containing protein/predicted nucleotidyltransferase
MIQRADAVDTVAMETAARIAELVRPWRIILFGSRARGTAEPHSDYDFYIEVDVEGDTHKYTLDEAERRIVQSRPAGGPSFDFKVMKRGTLERRRDDPGTIEWDVAREGKLLFADAAAPTTIAPAPRVRERPPKVPESVAEWLESAERDVRHADLLRRTSTDYWPEICWLSQQMCEKFIKALLVSRFVRPERTHNLTELLAATRRNGIDLGALDDECALLTEHAIAPRYPAGMGLTEENARVASAAANRIVSAVRALLRSK